MQVLNGFQASVQVLTAFKRAPWLLMESFFPRLVQTHVCLPEDLVNIVL